VCPAAGQGPCPCSAVRWRPGPLRYFRAVRAERGRCPPAQTQTSRSVQENLPRQFSGEPADDDELTNGKIRCYVTASLPALLGARNPKARGRTHCARMGVTACRRPSPREPSAFPRACGSTTSCTSKSTSNATRGSALVLRDLVAGHVVLRRLVVVLATDASRAGARRLVER
jgi:hypothetical protein